MQDFKKLPFIVTFTLAFLATTGPLAIDMYLSSFTAISSDLDASASQVQLTLTAFLLGLGLGQLFWGPISDVLGRRPVLLSSLIIFALTSALAVFSPNIYVFIGLRLFQGLTGAASVVLSRAIAADMTRGAETVRTFSLIAMLVGLGPIIAPTIGAVISEQFGWRGVLATVAVLTVLMLVLSAVILKESLPKDARHSGGLKVTIHNFKALFKNAPFVYILLSFALASATIMAYISASPFIGQKILGMSQMQYALVFALSASSLIIANFINARVARFINPATMFTLGVLLSFAGAILMLLLVAFGALTGLTFAVAAFVIIAGNGLTMSNGSALALLLAEKSRGSGSALLGATQFILGAAISPVVGLWGEMTAWPMAVTVVSTTFVALIMVLLYLRHHKKPS